MVNLATFYQKASRCAEQESVLARTVEFSRKHAPAEAPTLGLALRAAGECGLQRGRLREAEQALLEAESLLLPVFGEGSDRVVQTRTSLADLYARQGQPEKAGEWRKKAEASPPATP